MYHATGSSRSWANTAMPRPQRRPVHSAHAAVSTAAPITTNQRAVPYPLIDTSWAPPSARTTNTHGHDHQRDALQRHDGGRLTDG